MPDFSQVRTYASGVGMPRLISADATNELQWEQYRALKQAQTDRQEADMKRQKAQALVPIFTDEKTGEFDRVGYLNALRKLDWQMAEAAEKNFLQKDKEMEALKQSRLLGEEKKIEIANARVKQAFFELAYIGDLLNKAKEYYDSGDTISGDAWYSEALRDAPIINTIDGDGNIKNGIALPPKYDPRVHDIINGQVETLETIYRRVNALGQTPRYASQIGVGDAGYIQKIMEAVDATELDETVKTRLKNRAMYEPAKVADELDRIMRPALSTEQAIPAKIKEERARTGALIERETGKTEALADVKRKIQREYPQYSAEASSKIAKAYYGLTYGLFTLKRHLEAGNIDFFSTTKLGQFTNPDAEAAFTIVYNTMGREDSGAAISAKEWKEFKKLALNKNLLLTPEGREVVAQQIEGLIARYMTAGALTSGDPEWLSNVKRIIDVGISTANQDMSLPSGTTKPPMGAAEPPQSIDDLKKMYDAYKQGTK